MPPVSEPTGRKPERHTTRAHASAPHSVETRGDPVLTASALTKVYPPKLIALRAFDLTLHAGEIHGLVGVNGAGKSTLIKVLTGIEQPTSGTVSMAGYGQIVLPAANAAHRYGIGVVYQELPLLPNLTAAENMALGLEENLLISRYRRHETNDRYNQVARRFADAPLATDKLQHLGLYAWQIVAIIRAVAQDARVIILDEPTSSLSKDERASLHRLIAELANGGLAILYVTHFLDDILDVAHTVSVVRDGALVHRGPPSQLDARQLLDHMTGETSTPASGQAQPQRANSAGEGDALQVQAISCGLVGPVSFTASTGECLGVYGLEGSGARELIEAIFGLRRRTGTIRYRGRVVGNTPRAAASAGIGYVSGDRSKTGIASWSVALNHALPDLAGRPLFSRANGSASSREANRTIRRLSVKGSPTQSLYSLSGGNQQKILLGRWLRRSDMCLLLDEPTRGVDVAGRAAIHDELRSLRRDGMTIVVHSTDPEEIVELADRALVFAAGRGLVEVSQDDLRAEWLEELTRDRSLQVVADT